MGRPASTCVCGRGGEGSNSLRSTNTLVYQFVCVILFLFGFDGGVWDFIVLVPVLCLSFPFDHFTLFYYRVVVANRQWTFLIGQSGLWLNYIDNTLNWWLKSVGSFWEIGINFLIEPIRFFTFLAVWLLLCPLLLRQQINKTNKCHKHFLIGQSGLWLNYIVNTCIFEISGKFLRNRN